MIKTVIQIRAEQVLAGAGLRRTVGRLRILEALIRFDNPVSHAELSELQELSDMDRVSIYRNLSLFSRSGLIHSVMGEDGVTRFRFHSSRYKGCPGNHPHFLCLSCSKMICLTGQRLPSVDVPEGFTVSGKQLTVYGYCDQCATGKNK